MALEAGTQLGSFEITRKIGAGGMGEVYRATDTKLGRDVAIKTLPASLAEDKDRLARFEREAKLLASLHHAHIASVFSLDEHDGALYIAMELVEGKTLEERLRKGALPVDDCMQLGLQIALALEAAHEKGVVHRDLKPANIMITPDGVVKVLDFGLAKAFSGDPDEASPGHSPALSAAMTQQGLILGTAGYMSPEQASGQATDQRADIWSFGVVLYEMLTGMPVFSGESVPHILADVLKTEPDWNRLPKNLPWRVRQMLERCLTKKPRNRLHSIADARFDIESALSEPNRLPAGIIPQTSALRSRRAALAVGAGAIVTGFGLRHFANPFFATAIPADEDTWRHLLTEEQVVPALFNYDGATNALALSPNGQTLVFATPEALHRLPLDTRDSVLIQGSETESRSASDAVNHVFFSPDGDRLAYVVPRGGPLVRLRVTGGDPVGVTELEGTSFYGGCWNDDDTIVFATGAGLYSVDANGNSDTDLIIAATDNETYRQPQLLPDRDSILVSVSPATRFADIARMDEETAIRIVSRATGERGEALLTGGSDAHYVAPGYIVYVRGDALYAVAFDEGSLTVTSDGLLLVEGVTRAQDPRGRGGARFAVADNGTLAYLEGGLPEALTTELPPRPMVWVDPTNREEEIIEETADRSVVLFALSPDGDQILVAEVTREGAGAELGFRLWRAGNSGAGLTQLHVRDDAAIGSLFWIDEERAVASITDDTTALYWVDVNRANAPQPLSIANAIPVAAVTGLTDDGRKMVVTYRATGSTTFLDNSSLRVGLLPVEADDNGDHTIEPLIDRRSWNGQISPQGNLILYESNESGVNEIYIERYPQLGGLSAVSDGKGASEASWSESGDAIYYRRSSDLAIMKVSIDTTAQAPAGAPELVVPDKGYFIGGVAIWNNRWQPGPDGRLLMIKNNPADRSSVDEERPPTGAIVIDRGFGEDLRSVIPTK